MAKITTKEIYQQIVDGFKNELKDGKNPFSAIAPVRNISSLRNYTGFNKWHLGGIVKQKGYDVSDFATYKQITEAGGQVRKGEKGYPVFFWGTLYNFGQKVSVSASSETEALAKAKKKKPSITMANFTGKHMFIKHFTVFNTMQAEGCVFDKGEELESNPLGDILLATGAVVEDGMIPQYDIESDVITSPVNITSQEEFFALKASIESTAHKSRLHRQFEYAQEELVSTIGASFMALAADIKDVQFDISLVEKWLEILDENPMFLYKASSTAQKASDYILDKIANHRKALSA